MRWPVVAFIGYLVVGLELSIRPALALEGTAIAPSFVVPLVVFVALSATSLHALWTATVIGLVIDLTGPRGSEAAIVIGPNALGLALTAHLVLTVRGVTIKQNPITVVVLSILGTALTGLVVVAIFAIRSIYSPSGESGALAALFGVLGSALYTAASAAALVLLLKPMSGLFGFPETPQRRFGR